MRTIRFVGYLFYRYYSRGNNYGIPYASTIIAVTFLAYIHIFQILILLNQFDNIMPDFSDKHRVDSFLKMALFMVPGFVLFYLLITRSALEKMLYNDAEIKRGNKYLIIYIVSTIVLLFSLILYKKGGFAHPVR